MVNEFHDADASDREVLGYAEELHDIVANKFLGMRRIDQPTRKTGAEGRIEFDLTETVVLKKGHKEVVVKASPAKPIRVMGMIIILEGRRKNTN